MGHIWCVELSATQSKVSHHTRDGGHSGVHNRVTSTLALLTQHFTHYTVHDALSNLIGDVGYYYYYYYYYYYCYYYYYYYYSNFSVFVQHYSWATVINSWYSCLLDCTCMTESWYTTLYTIMISETCVIQSLSCSGDDTRYRHLDESCWSRNSDMNF